MDPEIQAMSTIASALEPLDQDARRRVLSWVAERFALSLPADAARGKGIPGTKADAGHQQQTLGTNESGDYSHLGELYDATSPSSDADTALVSAFWMQKYEGNESVESQPVNNALKHLGHGIGNITRAFEALKKMKPALVIQLEKQGKSKQARKRYKVTRAGETHVRAMIAGTARVE